MIVRLKNYNPLCSLFWTSNYYNVPSITQEKMKKGNPSLSWWYRWDMYKLFCYWWIRPRMRDWIKWTLTLPIPPPPGTIHPEDYPGTIFLGLSTQLSFPLSHYTSSLPSPAQSAHWSRSTCVGRLHFIHWHPQEESGLPISAACNTPSQSAH